MVLVPPGNNPRRGGTVQAAASPADGESDGIQSELFTAFGHKDEVSVVDRVERTSVDAQFHVSLVRVSSRSCEAVFWFRRFLSVVSRVFAEREAVRIVPPVPDPRK